MLRHRPVAAAIFFRPGGGHPAALKERLVPFHGRIVIGINAGHQFARGAQIGCELFVEKAAHLVAEGGVGCAQ